METLLSGSTQLWSSVPGRARGSLSLQPDKTRRWGSQLAQEKGSPGRLVGAKQGSRCSLPGLHRVREQSLAVAKQPDTPAKGAWIESGTPLLAPPAPCGEGAAPQLGGPATPCPGDPAGRPRRTSGSRPRLQRPSSRPPPQPAHLAQLLPLRQRLEGEALVALGAGVERRHVRPGPCSPPRRLSPPPYLTV